MWAEMKRAGRRSVGWLTHRRAVKRLRGLAPDADNLVKSLDLAYSFSSLGVSFKPMQYREELQAFASMAIASNPKVVVEIGPGQGGTLFVLSRVASPEAMLVTMDLPARILGMGHPSWLDELFREFPRGTQRLHIIRGDTHEIATFEGLKRVLGSRQIDLLFIDGDHSYDGVKKDFEMYSPLVSPIGMIAFHDILEHTKPPYLGVSRLWEELKSKGGECVEFVGPRDDASELLGGIGVIVGWGARGSS